MHSTLYKPITLLFALLLTLISSTADGDLVFETLADISMVAPDGNGSNFRSLASPLIENGEVVFFAADSNSNGYFRSQNGTLSRIVDSNTTVPGTGGNFGSFLGLSPSHSNGVLAFLGGNVNSSGVFLSSNDQITPVARRLDPVPGRNGSIFIGFQNQHLRNGTTVFQGAFGPFTTGLYHSDGNGISKIFDSLDNRPIPGFNNRTFSNFSSTDFDGTSILFTGGDFNSTTGIFTTTLGGSISTVVDINTAIPEGQGNFTFFDSRFAKLGDGSIVFHGRGSNNQNGIYLVRNGVITKIADHNTLDPSGTGTFTNLNAPTVSGDTVFFQGRGAFGHGIFQFKDGVLTEVISEGDAINGETLFQIVDNNLSFDGEQIVFTGNLGNRSSIIAGRFSTVPEPSSIAILLSGLIGSIVFRRGRRPKFA